MEQPLGPQSFSVDSINSNAAPVTPPPASVAPVQNTNVPVKKKFPWVFTTIIALCVMGAAGFGAYKLIPRTKPEATRASTIAFGNGYELSFNLPGRFTMAKDPDAQFAAAKIKDIKTDTNIATFSVNPYLIPGYIGEHDGRITVDGVKFVIASSSFITCPLSAIFPEQTLNQPYTLGFSISTWCTGTDRDQYGYEQTLKNMISSIKFNDKLKNALTAETVEDGILNLSFKSLNRTPAALKKMLLDYASKIDIGSLETAAAKIKKDYKRDQFFALSYEIIGNAMYPLVERIGTNPFEKGSPLYTLNDPVLHRYMYEYIASFYPKSIMDNIGYIYWGTDGLRENLAWVDRANTSSTALILYVDVIDLLDSLKTNNKEFMNTLIHESAHVLNYRNDQLAVDYSGTDASKASCATYYVDGWGCAFPNSYLGDFYAAFWKGKYADHPQLNLGGWKDYNSLFTDYWHKHPRDFVTAYATVNPVEDFAESFAFYTFLDNPRQEIAKGTVLANKVKYFDQTKGLAYLRNWYRKDLGLSYDTSIDTAPVSPDNFPQGKLLDTFKKFIPSFATYLKSENINDCGDSVGEGSCLHIDYHWGTDRSVAETLQWYAKSLPQGWHMEGDMANGYAHVSNQAQTAKYMFFVKDGALYPELKAKTVITFSEFLN